MSSPLSKILIIVGAIISFIPILGVDFLLDSYIRAEATARYQHSVNTITTKNQNAARAAVNAIREIVEKSPSLCTPTFINNVQKQIIANHKLAQIIVENKDRVQYCDGFNSETKYSLFSRELPVLDGDETVSIVKISGSQTPLLKISKQIGEDKFISAFVYVSAELAGIIPQNIIKDSYVRINITDGTQIISKGNAIIDFRSEGKHENIIVTSVANWFPIDARLVVSFDAVKAGFADLYTVLTLAALLIGIGFFLTALYFAKSLSLPTIDLDRAIAKGEFKPFYQPVVNLKTGRLVGCEVLVRWVKKDGSVVSPGFFIDLAENSGLAVPMTISLMKQVRKDLGELCKEMPELKIGINLFEGHFRNCDIVEDVKSIFADSGILFSQLVFEITERKPLTNQKAVDSVVGGLRSLGCKLALDDAGTGHSNLTYMQRLGVDIIKIDRVFVNMIVPEEDTTPILDGLISMAFDLDAEIIAEGVETEEQAIYLRSRGVVQAQGFLFAPALKKESYIELAKAMNGVSKPQSNIEKKAA